MTLCASCPYANRCSFLAAARLAQIHFEEMGRVVGFSVDTCSVLETLKKQAGLYPPGTPIEIEYRGEWHPGTVLPPSEKGWVSVEVIDEAGRRSELLMHPMDDAAKLRTPA